MIRTTKPSAGNKYYITQGAGGYSTCIVGKPTDYDCNVLANCVGYACGAFNEELGLGYEKYHLNCNAENFIERAIASGLSVVKEPVVGGIMVWEGAGSMAGHVAIVTHIHSDGSIDTAESGYGCSNPFWISRRYNNNGRWGMNSNYPYRGCIVNPNNPKPDPKPEPRTYKFNIGDRVIVNGPLYYTSWDNDSVSTANNIITTITRRVDNKHPYNFTGDLGWANESSIKKYEESKPTKIELGDLVRVSGTGNGASDGTSNWTRTYSDRLMKVILINKGAAYPYACNQDAKGTPNNPADVDGWFAANDVRK